MANPGYKLQEFVAHSTSVKCLSIGKKARRLLLTGGEDQRVNLWAIGKPSSLMGDGFSNRSLIAMAVGIGQKDNVDAIVKKFLSDNSTVMLFHYDGNVNGWSDLSWNNSTIHIVAQNQTKWWFAKRFLHPDVVNIYDYIFVWDEDLGVKNFNPGRYLNIVKSEGLEISQPALDPHSTGIHHRITIRKRTAMFHRRMYGRQGSFKCSNSSKGPPCAGWVEVMAPVFSRVAWHCAWNLIQNDFVHGWGLDIKIGYCAQGDRTQKVGIIDSEYIVHQGIQTMGAHLSKRHLSANHMTIDMQLGGKQPWSYKSSRRGGGK